MSRHHDDVRSDLSDLPDVFSRGSTPLLPSRGMEGDTNGGSRRSRRARSLLDEPDYGTPDYDKQGYERHGYDRHQTEETPLALPDLPPVAGLNHLVEPAAPADAPYLPGTDRLRAALDPELADHPLLLGLLRELPPRHSAPSSPWLDRWLEALRANLDLIYGTRG